MRESLTLNNFFASLPFGFSFKMKRKHSVDISGLDDVEERLRQYTSLNTSAILISNHEAPTYRDWKWTREFKLVANILKDNSPKRQTSFMFVPVDVEEFKELEEWTYMLTINGRIVKIGATGVGLKSRADSYLSGYHSLARGKSGKNSVTNHVIYDTFEFYLSLGCEIKMYGHKLKPLREARDRYGEFKKLPSLDHTNWEARLMRLFALRYNRAPALGKNSDKKQRLL
jgi:hypothetical protein